MEWMNRGGRPAAPTNQSAPAGVSAPSGHTGKRSVGGMRVGFVALLAGIALLLAALSLYFAFGGKSGGAQSAHVDSKKMQAVFLNGGQVYFGNIKSITDQYVRMSNIYYLRVNQQVQPNGQTSNNQDISLVKLGCELHGPQDSMVINQGQVIFWENLKDDGQVAKAVADYVKQNPNGQKCETTNSSSSSSSTTNSGSSATSTSTPAATSNASSGANR